MILIIPLLFLLLTNSNSVVGIPIESSNAQDTTFYVYCWSDSINDYTRAAGGFSNYEDALTYMSYSERDCYIREEE